MYRLMEELSQVNNIDAKLTQLQERLSTAENEYQKHAKQLSDNRQQAAKNLSKKVTQKMQLLSMQGGKFFVALEPMSIPNMYGLERVEFLVSANPGQPLQPLNKIASGGELSRIGLAIQVISAQNTATLIFDEVDSGIGGSVAEIVGQLLKELGNKSQVLCITHLPQVASQGHHHLQVKKHTKNNVTQTTIQILSVAERIHEIARMLGGIKITGQTLAHAKEMLDNKISH
jgi:DNA repair protein RecN (Recombination protein N)